MATAAAPPALGDLLGDAIDSGLNELASDAGIPEANTQEAPAGDGVIDATEMVAPEVEAPPDAAEAAPVADPGDGPYPISQDGAGYVVPKQEFQILDGQRQFTEAVQEFFPTANDAQVAYNEATDFRSMLTDYVTGDPNLIDSVLAHWAGMGEQDPTMQQQFRQSFAKMAERMPETLKQVNPQAYDQFMGGIINGKIEELYNVAAQTGDPADLFKAQEYDHALTGQYKDKTELPKYDPDASLRQQIEQRQQSLEQRENQIMDRDWNAFNGGWDPKTGVSSGVISGPKWQAYFSEINRAMEPFKANYQPAIFGAVVQKVNADLMNKLQTADRMWAQNHNSAFQSLENAFKAEWRAGGDVNKLNDRIRYFQNDFLTQARKYLPSVVKEVLGSPAPKPATTPAKAAPQPRTAPAAARPAQPPPARPNGQTRPAQASGKPSQWDAAFR